MSKYVALWEYLRNNGEETIKLSFDAIKDVLGFEIDHSFLNAKKEAVQYGYEVGKISLKNQQVLFHKIAAPEPEMDDAEIVATMTTLDIL